MSLFVFFLTMKVVLIIEDEIELLEEIGDVLRFEGFQVLKASTGEEGLEQARNKKPDIILCDVVMPGMSGLEVLAKIKQEEDTSLTPFIFITAKSERLSMRRAMDMGADDYIVKPFSRHELINSVRGRLKKVEAIKKALKTFTEDIVTGLPHEFRTPLNSILGFSKLIQEDTKNYSLDEISDMTGHIYDSGLHLFRLSHKYLTYVDILTNGENLLFEKVRDLEIFIEDLAAEVASEYGRLDDLSIKVDNHPLSLTKDYVRFALKEIVDNAFKFSEKETGVIIRGAKKDNFFRIEIVDEGSGIPEEVTARLSLPPMKLNGHVSRKGMAIFLVLRIIEINGGRVHFFGVRGKGTKVTVDLPVLQ